MDEASRMPATQIRALLMGLEDPAGREGFVDRGNEWGAAPVPIIKALIRQGYMERDDLSGGARRDLWMGKLTDKGRRKAEELARTYKLDPKQWDTRKDRYIQGRVVLKATGEVVE